jgi:hypothetical protein
LRCFSIMMVYIKRNPLLRTSQTNVPTLKIKDLSRKKIACAIYENFQVHKYSTHARRSSSDMGMA